MKRKHLGLLLLFVVLVFIAVRGTSLLKSFKTDDVVVIDDHDLLTYRFKEKEFIFEVVTTDQSRTQGLSGRQEIPYDGMLFVFEQPSRPFFWMNGMNFPLDFIWLKYDCVVELMPNVGIEDRKKRFRPEKLVDSVIEVKSGFIDKHDIKEGDCFDFLNNLSSLEDNSSIVK